MPHGNFTKAVLIDGRGVELTPDAEEIVLFKADGTLFTPTPDVQDNVQLRSSNGTVFNLVATDDGTLDLTEVV